MRTRRLYTNLFGAAFVVAAMLGVSACGGDDDNGTGTSTGSVRVSTTTTGDNPDDEYTIEVDGDEEGTIGANEEVTLEEIATGDREIELTDVADNCEVVDNRQEVEVEEDETAVVDFEITCNGGDDETGAIQVATTTTGETPDPDGYTVTVNGSAPLAIGVNDTIIVPDLTPDDYTVELSDLATGCTVAAPSVSVIVTAGQTAEVDFAVTCGGAAGTAPTISNLQFPETMTNAPGDSGAVTFDFSDPDADVLAMIVEVIADPSGAYAGIGLSPGDSAVFDLDVQGQTTGSTGLFLGCPDPDQACPVGTGVVTLSVSVTDVAGNRSNELQFSVEFVESSASVARRSVTAPIPAHVLRRLSMYR